MMSGFNYCIVFWFFFFQTGNSVRIKTRQNSTLSESESLLGVWLSSHASVLFRSAMPSTPIMYGTSGVYILTFERSRVRSPHVALTSVYISIIFFICLHYGYVINQNHGICICFNQKINTRFVLYIYIDLTVHYTHNS